jgi:Family of unknown function (DUF6328)
VAGLGIQVLFGFLLSLPFTSRFRAIDPLQRDLYLADVFCAVASIIALTAPVALHRLVFRRGRKEWLVRWANRLAIVGLAFVAAAVSVAVAFVVSLVMPGAFAIVTSCVVPIVFVSVWVLLPLGARSARQPPERQA